MLLFPSLCLLALTCVLCPTLTNTYIISGHKVASLLQIRCLGIVFRTGMGMRDYRGKTAGTVIRSKSVTAVIAGMGTVHVVILRE